MRELVTKFAGVFIKPGNPVIWNIKHKIEFLDPSKPIPHHKTKRISELKLNENQKVWNHMQKYLEKS